MSKIARVLERFAHARPLLDHRDTPAHTGEQFSTISVFIHPVAIPAVRIQCRSIKRTAAERTAAERPSLPGRTAAGKHVENVLLIVYDARPVA
jgi:hypothetical protein